MQGTTQLFHLDPLEAIPPPSPPQTNKQTNKKEEQLVLLHEDTALR